MRGIEVRWQGGVRMADNRVEDVTRVEFDAMWEAGEPVVLIPPPRSVRRSGRARRRWFGRKHC